MTSAKQRVSMFFNRLQSKRFTDFDQLCRVAHDHGQKQKNKIAVSRRRPEAVFRISQLNFENESRIVKHY